MNLFGSRNKFIGCERSVFITALLTAPPGKMGKQDLLLQSMSGADEVEHFAFRAVAQVGEFIAVHFSTGFGSIGQCLVLDAIVEVESTAALCAAGVAVEVNFQPHFEASVNGAGDLHLTPPVGL